MKRTIILSLTACLAVVLTCGFVYALSGECVNCHTMHNSQNGVAVAAGGPYEQLLKASCVGCHTETPSGNVDPVNSFGAPIVWSTTAPGGQGGGYTTAGGDFYWVAQGGLEADKKGHNVADIKAGQDGNIGPNIGFTPPGWDPVATPGALGDGQINGGAATWSNQLTCAGLYGCHGNHSDANQSDAIAGAHHGNIGLTATQATNPSTIGGSYRFLGGIKGLENSEWNWNETAIVHNEYYGVSSNVAYADKTTINYSCAQCHGVFHNAIGSGPWLRHPTDIMLPSDVAKEYQYYNPDGLPSGSDAVIGNTDYSIEAPVARPTVPATSSKDVTPGTDAIVMCLSCHRAHGSDQNDILRWDYTGMRTGDFTTVDSGCFTCHTTKNND